MLFLLALPVVSGVAFAHRYLLLYAPSNALIRRVHVTPSRWRAVAGLVILAGMLVGSMHALADAVEAGAPGWLNLVVLVLAWDAFKVSALALLVLIRRIGGSAPSALQTLCDG